MEGTVTLVTIAVAAGASIIIAWALANIILWCCGCASNNTNPTTDTNYDPSNDQARRDKEKALSLHALVKELREFRREVRDHWSLAEKGELFDEDGEKEGVSLKKNK